MFVIGSRYCHEEASLSVQGYPKRHAHVTIAGAGDEHDCTLKGALDRAVLKYQVAVARGLAQLRVVQVAQYFHATSKR
jgi:hypothetical protein